MPAGKPAPGKKPISAAIYIFALAAVITAVSVLSFTAARRYRTYIEYTFQRAVGQLSDYIGELDSVLENGGYGKDM